MTADEFYSMRNDRSLRYAGRVLDPSRPIAITGSPEYLATRDGQTAAVVLANLLGRMTPNLFLSFADVPLHPGISAHGKSLHGFILNLLAAADPYGSFAVRSARAEDYTFHLGRDGHEWIVHGCGWNAYVGPSPSPLPEHEGNAFGAGFAAITAAAKVFDRNLPITIDSRHIVDTLRWRADVSAECPRPMADLGELWFVGAGSVGSAAAYFMALEGLKFSAKVIDMDVVKVENLDRSPVFRFDDCGKPKADVLSRFLDSMGIPAASDPVSLARSARWYERQHGTPDLIISAANEDNVRLMLENGYPPVQVYGTTGQNWQSAVVRHVPGDPCSCCLFPPSTPTSTSCATGVISDQSHGVTQVDAALPFLSFAAGLMTAIEAAKLGLGDFPFSGNRTFFQPKSQDVIARAPIQRRTSCVCNERVQTVHQEMVEGSRYDRISKLGRR